MSGRGGGGSDGGAGGIPCAACGCALLLYLLPAILNAMRIVLPPITSVLAVLNSDGVAPCPNACCLGVPGSGSSLPPCDDAPMLLLPLPGSAGMSTA